MLFALHELHPLERWNSGESVLGIGLEIIGKVDYHPIIKDMVMQMIDMAFIFFTYYFLIFIFSISGTTQITK